VPKPRSVRDVEQQDGPTAAAFYAADEPPPPTEPARPPGWEDRHRRWTFHAPVDVLDALEAEAKRSGRSKSAVAVTALRKELKLPAGKDQ